jgi:hypothetical protein
MSSPLQSSRGWQALLPVALLAPLAAACAASSEQLVPMPSQDVTLSRPDLCRIYVLRAAQPMGAVRTMRVFDQDREIGTLAGDEYLCWERPPGRALLRVVYEGPRIDRGELEDLYDLQADAGSVHYLGVGLLRVNEPEALGDRRGSPRLHPLGATEGRKLVEESEPSD